ncbi:MAG TPA: hypothetical protein GX733_03595 [Tissierellia bacterium]|nr:hypothetical protein [Tissierellia bacterium]
MKAYVLYVLGFIIAALILALPGLLISGFVAVVSSKSFSHLLDIVGSIYLVVSLLILILGKKVRKQIRENSLNKAASAASVNRLLRHLLMSYNGMVVTAVAGILLMLIPVILH